MAGRFGVTSGSKQQDVEAPTSRGEGSSNEGAPLVLNGNPPQAVGSKTQRGKLPVRWTLLLSGLLILFCLSWIKTAVAPDAAALVVYGFWGEVLSLFVAELGVALIVAFIVAFFIERQSKEAEMNMKELEAEKDRKRRETEAQEAELRSQLIAKDVVQGVYGLRHKPSYVKSVLESNLQSNIVRNSVTLDYSLSELTEQQAATLGVDDPNRFVVINMTSTYEFENLSSFDVPFDVQYSVAVRHGEGVRALTGVTSLCIDGAHFLQAQIDDGLKDADDHDDKSYAWPQVLKGGGKLPVIVTVVSIKERSDNEVWGSYFATIDGATVRFQVLPGMVFGVRPLTSSRLKLIYDKEDWGKWESDGPILPNNSVVFWWRTPEDDGQ